MAIFIINTIGNFTIREQLKEFYKMIFGGVLVYLTLLLATLYTVPDKGFLIFLIIFLTVLYIYIFIFIPIALMLRIRKVVREIHFKEGHISLTSNNEYTFTNKEIEIKEVKNRFTGFSTKNKSGILIKTKGGKELWIIEDFFNEFEELRQSIVTFCL